MAVTITNINITSNLLTVTTGTTGNSSSPNNSFQAGDTVTLQGLTTNTFLNSQQVIVIGSTGSAFTASFTHANVNTSDTGTATTTKMVVRAAYNSSNDTDWKSWAQALSNALNNFGWVLDTTVNGMVNWSTTSGPSIQAQNQTTLGNNNGSWSSQGAWSNAHGAYTANSHYVTYADANTGKTSTWACVTGYTPTATSPPPPYDSTHWTLFPFEVWKGVSTSNSTVMFLKIEYINGNGGAYEPTFRVTLGTNDDTNGNVGTGANQQNFTQLFPSQVGNSGSTYFGSTFNCFFSGDAGNRFAALMWPEYTYTAVTGTTAVPGGTPFFFIERGISSTGTYQSSPTYWMWGSITYNQVVLNGTILQTSPSVFVKLSDTQLWCATASLTNSTAGSFTNQWGVPSTQSAQQPETLVMFPIYPVVGWVGNPITAAQSLKVTPNGASTIEYGDGPALATVTQQMYGSTRTYLCLKSATLALFGDASSQNNGVAMRFD